MEVFRICRASFAKKLTASGRANRWNLEDEFVIYTGMSRSLSTLELVVHKGAINPSQTYQVMVINIAEEAHLVTNILLKDLPKNWRSMDAYPILQQMGSKWYQTNQSLILKVPSAIIANEYNFIINTRHPDYSSKVSLLKTEDYFWMNG